MYILIEGLYHMKKIIVSMRTVFVVFLTLVTVSLFAQRADVGYVEGAVEYRSGGAWSDVYIGDQLDLSGQLRLGADGYAEILLNGSTIRLSRPGQITLSELQTQSSPVGVTGALAGRVGRFMKPDDTDAVTTVGGVRASEAVSEPEISWAGGEDVGDLLEEGMAYLQQNNIEEAFYSFEEAFDFSDDADYNEAGFLYAYSAFLIGEPDTSLEVLGALDPTSSDQYFVDTMLLHAQLLLDAGKAVQAAQRAQSVLTIEQTLRSSDPLSLQMAYFLNGDALSRQGDTTHSKTAYHQASILAPQTEIGRLAAQRAQ